MDAKFKKSNDVGLNVSIMILNLAGRTQTSHISVTPKRGGE